MFDASSLGRRKHDPRLRHRSGGQRRLGDGHGNGSSGQTTPRCTCRPCVSTGSRSSEGVRRRLSALDKSQNLAARRPFPSGRAGLRAARRSVPSLREPPRVTPRHPRGRGRHPSVGRRSEARRPHPTFLPARWMPCDPAREPPTTRPVSLQRVRFDAQGRRVESSPRVPLTRGSERRLNCPTAHLIGGRPTVVTRRADASPISRLAATSTG